MPHFRGAERGTERGTHLVGALAGGLRLGEAGVGGDARQLPVLGALGGPQVGLAGQQLLLRGLGAGVYLGVRQNWGGAGGAGPNV